MMQLWQPKNVVEVTQVFLHAVLAPDACEGEVAKGAGDFVPSPSL